VYLTPLVGGILADRVIGQRKSVIVDGVVDGHGRVHADEGVALLSGAPHAHHRERLLQVEHLDPGGGPLQEGRCARDRAFNVFYVGINLGAWLSPFICGTLGQSGGKGHEHWS
jgi:proton-dependent oligopeptide transporter, POT family